MPVPVIANIALSIMLPWLLGALLVWRILGSAHRNLPLILGLGYFLGFFALTALMRAFDAANEPIAFSTLATALLSFCVALLLFPHRPRLSLSFWPNFQLLEIRRWDIWISGLLLALIAFRYATLTEELMLRPLFAWDAFSNWTQRAQEWYLHNPTYQISLDSVSKEWVYGQRKETFGAYPHPYTISFISLWGMLASQSHELPIMNVFWLIVPIAIGLSAFGYLSLNGVSAIGGLIAVYLITSLPYMNVHSALAGYADIWMAGVISSIAFCIFLWRSTNSLRYVFLGFLFLLFMLTIKRTGILFGAIIALAIVLSSTGRRGFLVVTIGIVSMSVWLYFMSLTQASIQLPVIGVIKVDLPLVTIGGLDTLNFDFSRILPVLFTTAAVSLNWNILFMMLPLAITAGLIFRRSTFSGLSGEELLIPLILYLGIIFIFAFSERYYSWAADSTGINRILICGTPLLITLMTRMTHQLLLRRAQAT